MKKRRFIVLITVCSLLAAVLTACGSSGGAGAAPAEADAKDTAEENTDESAAVVEISEEDIIGRWVFPSSKDVVAFKEGGKCAVTPYRSSWDNETNYSIESNEVILGGVYQNYDTDGHLQYDSSEEQKKLIGDRGEFIPETDYYAGLESYSVGDKIATDSAEVVVNSLDFTNDSELRNIIDKFRADDLEAGQTYAHINFDVSNLSKQNFVLSDTIGFTLDYNSGFMFSTCAQGQSRSFLRDPSSGEDGSFNLTSGNSINFATVEPLDVQTYDLYIPCAAKVAEDQNASYVVYVTLPTESGIKEFAVNIK